MIDGTISTQDVQDPAASSSCCTTSNSVVIVDHRILVRHLLEQADQWIEHLARAKALSMRYHVLLGSRGALQVVALEAQAHHLSAGVR